MFSLRGLKPTATDIQPLRGCDAIAFNFNRPPRYVNFTDTMSNNPIHNSQPFIRRKILVIVETTNHFGRCIVEGIARFALEHHWRLDFQQRGCFDPVHLESIPDNIDGIISRTFNRSFAQKLMKSQLPVVELVGEYGIPQEILVDESALSKLVFEHFRERGLENFALFSDVRAQWSIRRLKQFEQTVKQAGFFFSSFMPNRQTGNFLLPHWTPALNRSVRDWLRNLPKPCGILLGQDIQAKKLYESCIDAGIRIPEDVAVVGAENDKWFCDLLTPALSSVEQQGVQFGIAAAQRLEEKINNPDKTFEPICIPPSYIQVRQSSDISAIIDEDIRSAIAFIREHISHGIKPDDVVREINISIRKLQREFNRLLGVSPQEYITAMQMSFAKHLLLETEMSLKAVSEATGFNSVEYFTRVFVREVGVSPGRYKGGL